MPPHNDVLTFQADVLCIVQQQSKKPRIQYNRHYQQFVNFFYIIL